MKDHLSIPNGGLLQHRFGSSSHKYSITFVMVFILMALMTLIIATTNTTTKTTTTTRETTTGRRITTTTNMPQQQQSSGFYVDDSSRRNMMTTERKKDEAAAVIQLPTIQLIGAQKAGTTAIADYLKDVVQVCSPVIFDGEPGYYTKEVHYFDQTSRYEEGLTFYAKRYKHCKQSADNDDENNSALLSMDATPNTLGYPERVREAYDSVGGKQLEQLKIIVILREPIARELSLYNHMVSLYMAYYVSKGKIATKKDHAWYTVIANNNDGSIKTFTEYIIDVVIPQYLQLDTQSGEIEYHASFFGTYVLHLRRWFELFDRKQILVMSYDELSVDAKSFETRLLKFLNANNKNTNGIGFNKHPNSHSSSHKTLLPSCYAQHILLDAFQPLNVALYELLDSTNGPSMEQRPYPPFILGPCTNETIKGEKFE